MKKVLHIATYYPPNIGGVEQTAMDVVDALRPRYEQAVLAFHHAKGSTEECADGVKIYRCSILVKAFSQPLSIRYRAKMRELLHSFRPDIVVIHFPNPFGIHYLLRFLKQIKDKHIKVITYYHSDIIKQKLLGKLFEGQTDRLLNRSDTIVATSPIYIEGSPFLSRYKEKCRVVPSCIGSSVRNFTDVDAEETERIRRVYKDKTICLFIGRHVRYKGLNFLIEAARYVRENAVFLIAGQGPLTEQLKRQAEPLENVYFLGVLKDVGSYLSACDIFTFPSVTKNEAFGLALAEAMWCGKPAVTFSIEHSGVNFVGINNETCLECRNADPKAFAQAVDRLAKDRDLRRRLGDNGRKRAQELFSPEAFRKHIACLFEQITKESGG